MYQPTTTSEPGLTEVFGLLFVWAFILALVFICSAAAVHVRHEQKKWNIRQRARRIAKIREDRNASNI